MPKTTVASFVIRFTQETRLDADPLTPWRAVIRHVQSDQEAHFTRMNEALAFIGQYVELANGTVRQDEGSEEEPKGR